MKIGKLKTKVLVVMIAAVVLSAMFSLAVSAVHTTSITTVTTTDKTEIYGGGVDGELRCNWAGFAKCIRKVLLCAPSCYVCVAEPSRISCIVCVGCAVVYGAYCVFKHCR